MTSYSDRPRHENPEIEADIQKFEKIMDEKVLKAMTSTKKISHKAVCESAKNDFIARYFKKYFSQRVAENG